MRVSIILIGLGLALGFSTGFAAEFIPGDIDDDGSFDIVDSVVLRRALAGLGPGITQDCIGQLPATGQMTCWDSGGLAVTCAGAGQDGEIQAGATLSYVDNGDGTITDLNTGLMWEKKDDNNTLGMAGIHDKDNTYPWFGTCSTAGTPCGTDSECPPSETCDATDGQSTGMTIFDYVDALNNASFAGHTDWRVPNHKELVSILDLETFSPSVDPVFNTGCVPPCTVTTCSCTGSFFYWSSTSFAGFPTDAWFVDFFDGFVDLLDRSDDFFVRAVRGGP